MRTFLKKWFDRNPPAPTPRIRSFTWIPATQYPTTTLSVLDRDSAPYSAESEDGVLTPPGVDPRCLFPLLQYLRDSIPDVSAGIWAWARLCSTPQSFSLTEGTESQQRQSRQILYALDHRILDGEGERQRGIDALVQAYFLSVFTYGAFCGEVVLSPGRDQIARFVIIDPATIRFKLDRDTRAYQPVQLQQDGSVIILNPYSFFYHGLDTDGLSPYGRSPLLALPLVVRLQQQLIQDMARAQHNAGYPMIHFQIKQPDRVASEPAQDYYSRLQKQMDWIKEEIADKKADSNMVTYDNVTIEYIGPGGHREQWSESIQAITEQVISALHLAPFMLGRNWGTTQTWGTAQYQLLTNNARTVQEGAKRLAEWLRNLELALHHLPCQVTHHFAPHHHIDICDRTQAFQTLANTLIQLKNENLLDEQAVKQRINTFLGFL
ncbi:MAG: hypothetical protein RBU29_03415 [bacterium]|jgi:hypothetical protein|nr:hypothetical protein [bacterium]